MIDHRPELERRTLALAFSTRDADLALGVLREAGLPGVHCRDLEELRRELDAGAGVVLLPEEVISEGGRDRLAELLTNQPPWSDLPVLVFARPGADSAPVARAMEVLGNVTVLERPTRKAALVSAVRSALLARERQYQIRAHLVERERHALELQQARRQLELVTETMAVAVARCSRDLRYVWVNHAYAAWFGRTPESMAGIAMVEAIGPAAMEVIRPHVEKVLAGQRVEFEVRSTPADRGPRSVQAVYVPVRDEAGHVEGWVASVADISRRIELEESLRESDRRKDEFLAVLAHELRNPLAPICNAVEILRLSGRLEPGIERVLEMMERQVNHMVRLVDDLLEMSRISRGKIELRVVQVDLESVLRSAVETSGPAIQASRHELVLKLPVEPLYLAGDPVRLAQVFANLLNNAAKYTPASGRIEIEGHLDKGQVAVSVRDNGQGIASEDLARVFDMFLQFGGSPDHRGKGGLGIGLNLARRLVEMHGGSIEARSDGRGKGSEFLVRLPLAVTGRSAVEGIVRSHDVAISPRRVLVVDDNHDAAESLGLLLKLLGADVQVVHGGEAALATFRAHRPSVVMLDLGMPGMDGFEVAQQIRSMPEGADTILIALTGWGQERDRTRTRDAGFDHHLVKPADVDALQALFASLSEKGRGLARRSAAR